MTLLHDIQKISLNTFYKINDKTDRGIIRLDHELPRYHLNFSNIDNDILIYFYIRITSWEPFFPGNRTDINELMSISLALFLRDTCDYSASLMEVPHPMFGWDEYPSIYAMYVILTQPSHSFATIDLSAEKEKIEKLIYSSSAFGYIFQKILPYESVDSKKSIVSIEGIKEWATNISSFLNEDIDDKVIYHNRENPSWRYYRSGTHQMSIFESKRLIELLSFPLKEKMKNIESLQTLSGSFFKSRDIFNFITKAIHNELLGLLKILKPNITLNEAEVTIIPLDNIIVMFYDDVLVIKDSKSGYSEYKSAREKHFSELSQSSIFLNDGIKLKWAERINDEDFELLVQDLLNLHKGVNWSRKVGASTDRDGGRDIICEWLLPAYNKDNVSIETPPAFQKKKILVQVKAYTKPVGKAKVTDIRDIVEHYDADGYLLVTSNLITSQLTEHLEKLRDKNKIWVDWWTNIEVEKLLLQHPHLISKYSHLVTYSTI